MSDKKDKCNKLLDKIFGSNFYFAHTTRLSNLYPILKSGKIKIKNDHWTYKSGAVFLDRENVADYAYCWTKYDDAKLIISPITSNTLLIDPRILLHEDIVFNTQWFGAPLKRNEFDPDALNINNLDEINKEKDFFHNGFSIYLNKSDSKEERFEKLRRIKIYIETHNKANSDSKYNFYFNTHEFLFSKDISLKKYLIGIIFGDVRELSGEFIKKMNIMLDKKYAHVKMYNGNPKHPEITMSEEYPKLLDLIC